MFSKCQIETEIAEKCPENLIFCTDEDLYVLAETPDIPLLIRARCTAELVVRCFFYADKHRDKVDHLLSNGEFSSLCSHIPYNFFPPALIPQNLWLPANPFSNSCLAAVFQRFRTLLQTEGLIPVYSKSTNDGYLIPFELIEMDRPEVIDFQGNLLEEWTENLQKIGIPVKVKLHCSATEQIRFSESSMMLPVFCAFLRHQGTDLPHYNPFRIIFSGSFNEENILEPVSTIQKYAKMADIFSDFTFVIPASESKNAFGRNIRQLPCLTLDKLLPYIQEIIDQQEKSSLQYALKRIAVLQYKVQYTQYIEWETLIHSLENNAVLDEDENPDEYLLNLMLQSEANCHCGRTSKAAELNCCAQEYASHHGHKYEKQLYRLQIERLIILLDNENFSQIQADFPDLEKNLASLNDPDLWMRYHGTMGQIEAYGTLSGISGYSKEESLRHFTAAKDKAFELNSLQDKRQDLNYIHLWHVLFCPGTAEEKRALQRAENMLNKEQDENFQRNYWFLLRQKIFAWYRCLLSGNMPEFKEPEGLLDYDSACGVSWQQALCCKYMGALLAASGDLQKAEKYFQIAMLFAPNNQPVLQLIYLTILAEAWYSLQQKQYKKDAEDILHFLKETSYFSIGKWETFLNGIGEDHPGLFFWY